MCLPLFCCKKSIFTFRFFRLYITVHRAENIGTKQKLQNYVCRRRPITQSPLFSAGQQSSHPVGRPGQQQPVIRYQQKGQQGDNHDKQPRRHQKYQPEKGNTAYFYHAPKKYLPAVKAQLRQEKGVYPHPGKAPVCIFSPRPPADLPARKNTAPKAVTARQLS